MEALDCSGHILACKVVAERLRLAGRIWRGCPDLDVAGTKDEVLDEVVELCRLVWEGQLVNSRHLSYFLEEWGRFVFTWDTFSCAFTWDTKEEISYREYQRLFYTFCPPQRFIWPRLLALCVVVSDLALSASYNKSDYEVTRIADAAGFYIESLYNQIYCSGGWDVGLSCLMFHLLTSC